MELYTTKLQPLDFPPIGWSTSADAVPFSCSHFVADFADYVKEREKMSSSSIKFNWPEIQKIEVLKPGKVVRVTLNTPCFVTNKSYKQICRAGDIFDFRVAVALALIKDMGLNLTPEGNEYYAKHFLKCYKDFNKVVDRGIKNYIREKKDEEKRLAAEKEAKEIRERKRAKAAAKRKARKERRVSTK